MADQPDIQLKREFENAGKLTSPMPWEAVGTRTLVVSGTMTGIWIPAWGWTGTMLNDAQVAIISCAGTGTSAGARFTWDGATTPSQNVGHLIITEYLPWYIYGMTNIQRLAFISEDGAPIELTVTLER